MLFGHNRLGKYGLIRVLIKKAVNGKPAVYLQLSGTGPAKGVPQSLKEDFLATDPVNTPKIGYMGGMYGDPVLYSSWKIVSFRNALHPQGSLRQGFFVCSFDG